GRAQGSLAAPLQAQHDVVLVQAVGILVAHALQAAAAHAVISARADQAVAGRHHAAHARDLAPGDRTGVGGARAIPARAHHRIAPARQTEDATRADRIARAIADQAVARRQGADHARGALTEGGGTLASARGGAADHVVAVVQ